MYKKFSFQMLKMHNWVTNIRKRERSEQISNENALLRTYIASEASQKPKPSCASNVMVFRLQGHFLKQNSTIPAKFLSQVIYRHLAVTVILLTASSASWKLTPTFSRKTYFLGSQGCRSKRFEGSIFLSIYILKGKQSQIFEEGYLMRAKRAKSHSLNML